MQGTANQKQIANSFINIFFINHKTLEIMLFPKFIIQNNTLILGYVEYHYELKQNENPVNGGGWFNIKNQNMTFWKDSQEFGKAQKQDIENCISSKMVFLNGINISDTYNFLIKL